LYESSSLKILITRECLLCALFFIIVKNLHNLEMTFVPEGANLGLGCGNPVALALLREGEIVLDLGCGVGFDCFLAADRIEKKDKMSDIRD
jgi:hypothetical protein